jgi:hypothetical protein
VRCSRTYGRAASLAAAALLALAAVTTAADAREITAARTTSPPVIDGRLDDPCWAEAVPSSDFRNFRDEMRPATQQTTVRLCYDAGTLYVAFECLEDDVASISAAIAQRDAEDIPEEDDCVAIALDTFRDNRSSYSFLVSALGTKRDVHASECGRSRDVGWDAVWDVAVATLSDRWTAELAIPFSALRWAAGDSLVWGVDFARVEMPHREYSLWSGAQGEFLDPTGFGTLLGLSGIEGDAGLELLPYMLGKYDTSRLYDYPFEPAGADWSMHGDAGLDVEYAPTPYVTVNATANPDFAQIEADPNQINLSGDEIWLEERRPFFSENADLFQMPLRLLYTRRMEDIVFGGKVTGKAGAGAFAALYARSNDLPRDEYGGALTDSAGQELAPETSDYGALVYRQDLFGSATAGAYVAAREREDGYNRVGAVMAGASPFSCMRLNAIAARTYDSGDLGDDEAYAMQWSYDASGMYSEGTLQYVGDSFAPEIGFVPADSRGALGGEGYLWKRFVTDAAWLDEAEFAAWAGRYDTPDGPIQSSWAGGEAAFHLPIGCVVGLEYSRSYDVRDYVDYPRTSLVSLYLYTGRDSWSGVVASAEFGEFHHSNYLQLNAGARIQPVRRLTIETEVTGVTLREYEDLDWLVGELRANYTLSPTLYLRALVLSEHVRQGVSGSGTADESDRYDLGLLCGWEFEPGSMLYLAYNQARERESGEDRVLDPTVVLKISRLIDL